MEYTRFLSENTASITYHIKHNVYYTDWRHNAKGITIEKITQRFVSFKFALIFFNIWWINNTCLMACWCGEIRIWHRHTRYAWSELEVVDRVNTSLLPTSKCQIYVIKNSTMLLFRISQHNNDNNKKRQTKFLLLSKHYALSFATVSFTNKQGSS